MKQFLTLALAGLLLPAFANSQSTLRYDVIIDELMADPSPQVGLPNSEWIELKNRSAAPVSLQGWRIGDLSGQSGPMPNFVLKPDSFLIVCTGSAVAALSAFGTVISVTSFPSLNNSGDQLVLRNAQGRVMHCVNYTDKWYKNDLKAGGGWSLEMIDTRNPCSGASNWVASNDVKGGTPGRRNSADGANADRTPPRLVRAYATDSLAITLVFDEPMDSLGTLNTGNYRISNGIGSPVRAGAIPPVFDHVLLTLPLPLQRRITYEIAVQNLTDCAGNTIQTPNKARVGLPERADSLELVINEVLFNPSPSGVDYVEIYNRSKKITDLKTIFIANRTTTGSIGSINALSNDHQLLFPEDFMVVTSDSAAVKRNYITLNPEAFTEPGSMPSYNNDKGDVVLLNEQGKIIDELQYNESWHHPLLVNHQGVALERIDQNGPTQSPDNWHSASTSSGYGTPTYANSQSRTSEEVTGEIRVTPEIVSPDNDGFDDYATIDYRFPSPGYLAGITIFDAGGRPVRYLQRTALCGINGSFRWDGLGEKNQPLATGIYIVFTEIFNLQGKRKQFRNVIVLARKN